MSDDLHKRLTDYLTHMEPPRAILVNGAAKVLAEDTADALLSFVREEIDNAVKVERFRHTQQALPDRWVSLRRVDFIGLIELYRERREVYNEDHDDALDHLLAEVDFEPNQDDLFERRSRLD